MKHYTFLLLGTILTLTQQQQYNSGYNPAQQPSYAPGANDAYYQNNRQYENNQGYQANQGYQSNQGYQNNQRFQLLYQPTVTANSTAAPNVTDGGNVIVNVKLTGYRNPSHMLADGSYCVCVTNCQRFTAQTVPRCYMSFMILLSSADGPVRYLASNLYYLKNDATGELDLTDIQQAQTQDIFSVSMPIRVQSKPKAITVFVHHYGKVLDANGLTAHENTVAHADTFVLQLNNVSPSVNGQTAAQQTATLTGQLVTDSSLSISYSVQCATALVGPDCDLACNKSTADNSIALCRSNTTDFFSVCRYSGQNQVGTCQACPWGIRDNLACSDGSGGVLEPQLSTVVSTKFRTATIILGCVAGLLLLLLLVVTIYSCVLVNKKMHAEEFEAPGHNYHSSLRAEGSANRPLLQASYTAPSPSVQSDSYPRPPAAAPRSVPSLDAVPAKSSLRKTNFIPPAHIGGGSSVNDTLNSSFASSVPMPPSREADV